MQPFLSPLRFLASLPQPAGPLLSLVSFAAARLFPGNENNRTLPGYESVENQPVTVVKGQAATVTLTCTNRVGGAEAYKEDEEWVKSISGTK